MARSTTLKIDIISDGSKAERAMDRVGAAAGRLGKAVALGAGAAVVALGALAVESVKHASHAEQAFGATEAVFGKYADTVKAKAGQAATAVGLSGAEYADLANVIGSQLRNAGTAVDQLAPKTDKLIGLGADLAAQFGGSTADAVAAVSSLLKGETDPIERYGVSIKKSDINARLAAQGQDKLTGAALKTAEANAALKLLTEQTATAQGAFAREGGTAANSWQKINAIWVNIQATLGSYLLPVLATLGTWIIDVGMPAIQGLADKLGPILGPILAQLGAFVSGTVLPALRNLGTIMATNVTPTVTVLGTFIKTYLLPPLLAIGTFIYTKVAPAVAGALGAALTGARNAIGYVTAALDRNRPALDKLGTVAKAVGEFVTTYLVPVLGDALRFALEVVGTALGGAIDGLGGFVGWLESAWEWVGKVADKIRNSGIGQLLSSVGGAIGGVFGSAYAAPAMPQVGPAGAATASGGALGLGPIRPVSFTAQAPTVQVFIGERQITDLVRVEVRQAQRAQARRVATGVLA